MKYGRQEPTEIVAKIPRKQISETQIKTTVQNAIKASLGPDYFRYIQKNAEKSKIISNEGFTIKLSRMSVEVHIPHHMFFGYCEDTQKSS